MYLSRICWNSNGWVFPSGEASHLEKDSFVTDHGFGHEEWLLNFTWLLEGYHYGFLQPIGSSFERVTGQTADLLLYAINPNRQRVYVGEIHGCEVLTRAQAKRAFEYYKRQGWLKEMKQQLREIGADLTTLNAPLECFNVRFRPTNFEGYQPLRLAAPDDAINKTSRYRLMAADKKWVQTELRRRKGSTEPPQVRTINRSGHEGVIVDPVEKAMQGELLILLQNKFGKDNVTRETDCVDLTVVNGNLKLLVELKSDSDARMAIRKALGQVLEYAYYNANPNSQNVRLIIIAPGPVTPRVTQYVKLLNENFRIPVSYAVFSSGETLPSVF